MTTITSATRDPIDLTPKNNLGPLGKFSKNRRDVGKQSGGAEKGRAGSSQTPTSDAGQKASEGYMSLAEDALNGDEGALDGFSMALTDRTFAELSREDPNAAKGLLSLLKNVRDQKIQPDIRVAGRDQSADTWLPAGVKGAFVGGERREDGTIVIADGLDGAELEETMYEEFGEAIAHAATGRRIDLAPGDVGARLRIIAGAGADATETPFEELFTPNDRDTVEIKLDGETVDAQAAATATGTPDHKLSASQYLLANATYDATTNDNVITKSGIMTSLGIGEAEALRITAKYGGKAGDGAYQGQAGAAQHLSLDGIVRMFQDGVLTAKPANSPDQYNPIYNGLPTEAEVEATHDKAEVAGVIANEGAAGLISYAAGVLGFEETPEQMLEYIQMFAEGGWNALGPNAQRYVGDAARSFAVAVGVPNSQDPASILQKAVRYDLGMEHSDHKIDKWQEFTFMGTADQDVANDGATPETEFARAYLSAGRTVTAETKGSDRANYLDQAHVTADDRITNSRALPTGTIDTAGASLFNNYPITEDGSLNPLFYNMKKVDEVDPGLYDVNADGTVTAKSRQMYVGNDLKTLQITPDFVQKFGPKLVYVVQPPVGANVDASKLQSFYKEVDYNDVAGQKAAVAEGMSFSHMAVAPMNAATKTMHAVSDEFAEATQSHQYSYSADGVAQSAPPSTRMAQFFHDTEFKYTSRAHELTGRGFNEHVEIMDTSQNLSDKDALWRMLNELGLDDGQINTLVQKASEASGDISTLMQDQTVGDIFKDIGISLATFGISDVIRAAQGEHVITKFSRSKLTAAGRNTGQADVIAEEYEAVHGTGAMVAAIAGAILDLGDLVPSASLLRAARKGLTRSGKKTIKKTPVSTAGPVAEGVTPNTTPTMTPPPAGTGGPAPVHVPAGPSNPAPSVPAPNKSGPKNPLGTKGGVKKPPRSKGPKKTFQAANKADAADLVTVRNGDTWTTTDKATGVSNTVSVKQKSNRAVYDPSAPGGNGQDVRPDKIEGTLRRDWGGLRGKNSHLDDNATKVGHLAGPGPKNGYDGGHMIPHRLMGPTPDIGIVPQNSNLNTGAWKKMETDWADWTRKIDKHGGTFTVEVEIDIKYSTPTGAYTDGTPTEFIVDYDVIDSTGKKVKMRSQKFKNKANETFDRDYPLQIDPKTL